MNGPQDIGAKGPDAPPAAARKPLTDTRFGHTRTDEYAWLRDDGWQAVMRDPRALEAGIRAHLEAENAYTEAVLAPTENLQKTLFEEMKGRIKEDDSTVPSADGAYEYFVRFETGGQQPVFCRQAKGHSSIVEVLYDGNAESEGFDFFRLASCRHAPDHRHVAYALDTNGSEYYVIAFRHLESGRDLPDRLENCQGGAVWANDGETLFYTALDENHRPNKVMRHRLGDDQGDDALVYEEKDPGFQMGISLSESRRFVLIGVSDHTTSEYWYLDTEKPDTAAVLVHPRSRDLEYDVSHAGDRFLILTNADGAEDFKIVSAPITAPGAENWQDLVAHRAGVLIRSMVLFEGHLVRHERENGLPRIVIRGLADGAEHAISFDQEAYDLGLVAGHEFATPWLRFTYSSPSTPQQTFDYHMVKRQRRLRKTQEVPSGHDAADYVVKRLMAPADDGERVPVTVLMGKDTPIDGSAPLLLYGYGSYGHAMPASFVANRLSLVDRGFIYAIAHVRGGMERGYRWYLDGKRGNKANTFTDFLAAARHLIEQGLAAPGRIVGHGGSAGGMLMGAAVNMAPDLFAGIIAEVPFVDVMNTMLDETLPLTPPEWPEWGNPITDEAAYKTILAYSPYDNVRAQAYPLILATAGLTDPRVTYWEPAKWVARLRHMTTGAQPVLLRTNLQAGHGGAAGRFDRLKEVALVYAVALMAVDAEQFIEAG